MKKLHGPAPIVYKDEFKRLLKVLASNKYSTRDILVIYFSFGLGLRAVELAAIKLFQVIDENENIIEELKLLRTKGQKYRSAYLADDKLKQAIKNYLVDRKKLCDEKKYLFTLKQPLFLSQKGGHFSNQTLAQMIKRLYLSAGIKASSHSGRRTFATNLYEQGTDIRAIQVLLGHDSINQTAEYIGKSPATLKQVTKNALY